MRATATVTIELEVDDLDLQTHAMRVVAEQGGVIDLDTGVRDLDVEVGIAGDVRQAAWSLLLIYVGQFDRLLPANAVVSVTPAMEFDPPGESQQQSPGE